MNEILETRGDGQIIDNKEVSHLDVSLKTRNTFQKEVLEILIAGKMLGKNDPKKTLEYAESIHKFIDNPDIGNPDIVQIRELIKQEKPEKLKEAAQLMVEEIHKEEEALPKAA